MTRTPWVFAGLTALPSIVGIVSPRDLEVPDQARLALYVSSALDESWLDPRERGMIATRRVRPNAAELDAAQLAARASASVGTWVVLSGSGYAELAADSVLFCRLGSPRPILQSPPRRTQHGDPLVLAPVDARHREDPPPARRP